MTFTRAKFGLHFSMPLDAQDWANLAASRVKTVMLPLAFADPVTLQRMRAGGVTRIILRLANTDLLTDETRRRAADDVGEAWVGGSIAAVVLGTEPENDLSFRYGVGTWGQGLAWLHSDSVRDMAVQLGDTAPTAAVVAPGWSAKAITEDDQPQPGAVTWREICAPVYNTLDGAGCHLYCHSWQSAVDMVRAKFALMRWQELDHKPLWVDEVGIYGHATETEIGRMTGYLEMATMLLTHTLGRRVEAFIPFVSNGTGVGWPPRLLLRDPAVYRMVGEWMGAR